jgi:predicted ArsR family transcriptional regulator
MTADEAAQRRVRAVSRLADPLRRRLYQFVISREEPASRDQAAASAGIGRSLAAYHLDMLVDDGLLEPSYARTSGRTGPGAGRTAKLYRRSSSELVVTVPTRDYELAASLLADAVEHDPTGTVKARLNDRARDAGLDTARELCRDTAHAASGLEPEHCVLDARGYEPYVDEDGTTRMRNCPFHRLVAQHRDLICHMNIALVSGLLEGIDAHDRRAILAPRPGHCCVAITRTAAETA